MLFFVVVSMHTTSRLWEEFLILVMDINSFPLDTWGILKKHTLPSQQEAINQKFVTFLKKLRLETSLSVYS